MIIVVSNTKGGVGKSAFSMQVAAPYVYTRKGSVTLFEIDDYNFDSDDYRESVIETISLKLNKGIGRVIERLVEAAVSNKHLVIDLGGNKTCGEMLEAMGSSPLKHLIDAFIIPVSQTGKDVENAQKTCNMIKEFIPDSDAKMFLGVTRTPAGYDMDDVQYLMPDAFELAQSVGMEECLILPDNLSIPASRKLGMTVYELGSHAEKLSSKLNSRLYDEQKKDGANN